MSVYESVVDAVGATPLIRLNRLVEGIATPVYVKAEMLNPGGSVKDRAAREMVLAAERDGSLLPGGTIVEGTSGNTGVGLAMVAAQRGYRAVVVVPDKSSAEKIALLRAYGAEVVVTTAGVPRQHPDHVSQIARRLSEELPRAWLANQYDNPANPKAHQKTTGPEIWAQTGGKVTHFVAGVGTGGTITGTGEYLKQVSGGKVRIVGADPVQSTYGGGDGSPYYVESIGHYLHPDTAEDVWPESFHPTVVDEFVRVTDREALFAARDAARREGLLVGGSAGTAIAAGLRVARQAGPDALVVVLLPDSGRSYLSKYFDDGWMARTGFLDATDGGPLVRDVVELSERVAPPALSAQTSVKDALADLLSAEPIAGDQAAALVVLPRVSDAPTRAAGDVIGTVTLDRLRDLAADPASGGDPLRAHVTGPLVTVGAGEQAAAAAARIAGSAPGPVAVLVDGRVAALVEASLLEPRPAVAGLRPSHP